MQKIRVEYIWTKERLVQAMKSYSGVNLSPLLIRIFDIVLGLLLLMFGWMMFEDAASLRGRSLWIFAVTPLVYWFVMRFQHSWWWITRNFEKRPEANSPILLEFAADKIRIDMENLANSELVWRTLSKVVESHEGFLIYHNEQLFNWVPFDSFKNENDIDTLREWAKNSGVKYVTRRKVSRNK